MTGDASGADGGGEGFLSRWSRRKRTAAVAPPPAPPVAPAPPEAVPPGAPTPAGAGAAFDPASLPPVESLTADSDFAAFLREEVPAALRNAALRRAWSLDPAIRDFVGPADYAWDFNASGGVPGFSLDRPDNVERLLAQVVGLDAPPPEGEPEEEAPSLAIGAAAPALPEPVPAGDAAPDTAHPIDADAAGGDAAAGALPGPSAGPPAEMAEMAEMAEILPRKRRHGGALPT